MNATITTTQTAGMTIFAAMVDGQAVSTVNLTHYAETEIDEDGYEVEGEQYLLLDGVWTDKGFRGQGLSRQTMQAALVWAAENHPTLYVRLIPRPDHDTDMDKLVAFYESVGFGVVGDESGTMEL